MFPSYRYLFLSILSFSLLGQNISTIVGGGPRNLPALQTGFSNIDGLAVDASGNVFVSLSYRNQIWKIDTSGRVNVLAGSGASGFAGDGGQALNASLCSPEGLALDTAGSLYVADSCNGRIRKVTANGVITTVAGGSPYQLNGPIGDNGLATSAALSYPVAVALDSSNNLYIADRYDQRVRLVSGSTARISTFAGNGTAGFSGDGGTATGAMLNGPVGIAVTSTGVVYIADSQNNCLRKVAGGTITTAAGNGTAGYTGDGGNATLAQLNYIAGVSIDQFNDVFILEASDVREIPAGQSNIITFAGGQNQTYSGDGSSPTSASFSYLTAMAFDSSLNLYLGDTGDYHIRKASLTTVSTFAGNGTAYLNGDAQPAVNANIQNINGMTVDNSGSLLFADYSESVRKLTLGSGMLTTVGGNGLYGFTADGNASTGSLGDVLAVTSQSGGNFYVIDSNRIRRVSNGTISTVANVTGADGFDGDGGPAISALFEYPTGLALAQNGDLYIADPNNGRVRVISAPTNIISTAAGNGTSTSTGDGGAATDAGLVYPSAIALDGNGNLFICDSLAFRVRKVNLTTKIITSVAGNGGTNYIDGVSATVTGLNSPNGIFADQAGNLFISDSLHYRIRKVTAGSNIISTVAGNGNGGFSGDGGLASAAGIDPVGITMDRAQNLYIADRSGRIRTTAITACFFTLSSPTVTIGKAGGTGSLAITATSPSCPYSVSTTSPFLAITGGASGMGSATITFSVAANTGVSRSATVSLAGQTFAVVQTGISLQYNVGFFQPGGPSWALDSNGSGMADAGDRIFTFAGQPGAIAVVGDWNGDGRSKVGYYINGFWVLDFNGNGIWDGVAGGDRFYAFGGPDSSYVPVVGDWSGSGTTKIGFYRYGFWALDMNGDGTFNAGDVFYAFGGRGAAEVPVLGDWNGDKRTKIGFFYQGAWAIDYNGDGIFTDVDKYYTNFTFAPGDKPVVGDWTGDGKSKVGIYRSGFWILDANGNGTFDGVGGGDRFHGFGGIPGEVPMVADWNGDGRSKIGVYSNGFWTLDFNGNGTYDSSDRSIPFYGGPGSQPIMGRW